MYHSQVPQDLTSDFILVLGLLILAMPQSMWNNRQNPRVYQAFAELYGSPKLWVTIDRVGVKLPPHKAHPEYVHPGFTHWDMDPTDPLLHEKLAQGTPPWQLQGVIALEDTAVDMG
jgi:hypothetical protein